MDFLKIAGKLAGGKPGQDQTQGSGSSGLMHKITDAVTGQNHPGEKQNQRPYGMRWPLAASSDGPIDIHM